MSVQPNAYVSPEDYIADERKAEYKSEYYAGEVFAMSGASRRHNLIVHNFVVRIGTQLMDRPCETYSNDMRVSMPSSRFYVYPDIVVVCGEPQFEDGYRDTLLNPTLLI